MPIVTINMFAGRTDEQKRALVSRVTEAIVETVDAKPENVSIIINEMSSNNFAKNGKLKKDQV